MSRIIPGIHAVKEALEKGFPRLTEIWVSRGKGSERIRDIIKRAGEKGIPLKFKKEDEFAAAAPGIIHQGVAGLIEDFQYSSLEGIISSAREKDGPLLLMALDHITDEGNVGALIRTAAFFGTFGLILPKDRSAGISARVVKRSAGTCLNFPVARVVNLVRALELLEKKGFWIIGAAGEASLSIYNFDWNRDLVLVLGNEEKGLGRAVRKSCHQLVGIPSAGGVESLNVAVAGGVIMSEIMRQRLGEKGSNS
jgi:23S rRNA (guanosine2251-2'-O)-methyltransferase